MKSNEEFIAGIYEKAAAYTEETKVVKVNFAARAAKIVAMAAVCIGLAGVGSLVLGRGNNQNPGSIPEQTGEDYGIALTSETGDDRNGVTSFRIGPVAEIVTFTGVVESIDTEENRIWLKLEFDETAPADTAGSVVCIKWDMLEKISEEIMIGTRLTVTGALNQYENEASEYNGCAELVLTNMENLEIR